MPWQQLASAILSCLLNSGRSSTQLVALLQKAARCCEALHNDQPENADAVLAAILHLAMTPAAGGAAKTAGAAASKRKPQKSTDNSDARQSLTANQAATCLQSICTCFATLSKHAPHTPEGDALLELAGQAFTNLAYACTGQSPDAVAAACAPALLLCLAVENTAGSESEPAAWTCAAAANAAVNGLLSKRLYGLMLHLLTRAEHEQDDNSEPDQPPASQSTSTVLAAELHSHLNKLAEIKQTGRRADTGSTGHADSSADLAGLLNQVCAQLDVSMMLAVVPLQLLGSLLTHGVAAVRKAATSCCKQAFTSLLHGRVVSAAAQSCKQQPAAPEQSDDACDVSNEDHKHKQQAGNQEPGDAAGDHAASLDKLARLMCTSVAHVAAADADATARKHACAAAADMFVAVMQADLSHTNWNTHDQGLPANQEAAELLLESIEQRVRDSSKLVQQEACKTLAAICAAAGKAADTALIVRATLQYSSVVDSAATCR